jgi:S1-C subfamily serine protease
MPIVDIIIVLLFITSLLRGIERGLVRQACSTVGLVVGFFLGVMVQAQVVGMADSDAAKAGLSLAIIITMLILATSAAEYAGNTLKHHVRQFRWQGIETTDRALGAIVGGVTLLLLCWLIASAISSLPAPGLQRAMKQSAIISQLNETLPTAPDLVSRLGNFIEPNGFPEVFTGLEPAIDTDTPLPSIGELDAAVQQSRASVVKIEGEGCGQLSIGSGFVADTDLVITNAHVVAGVTKPTVIDGNGRHAAQVIWFDPELDLAILKTTNLAGQPLPIVTAVAGNNTAAAVLGYPGGGAFSANPATILDSFVAEGRDIYNQGKTERQIYSLKADVVAGNSGGPLIDVEGNVIGLIFAESTTYDEVGYALIMDVVASELNQAKARNQVVSTGNCTH